MEKLKFSIDINAPRERVWDALWQDKNYRDWTSAFMEGSYAKSNWEEGGKIQFLTPDGDGMYSVIERKIPNEYMSFKHIGHVKDGTEQPVGEDDKQWSGAMENYELRANGKQTSLRVEVDSFGAEWENMLKEAFPKALNRVKEIAEE